MLSDEERSNMTMTCWESMQTAVLVALLSEALVSSRSSRVCLSLFFEPFSNLFCCLSVSDDDMLIY